MPLPVIIMIDQDGVMCNPAYEATFHVQDKCQELLSRGWGIVANSNTPYQRLLQNTTRFLGVRPNGVIAENGSGLYMSHNNRYVSQISRLADNYVFQIMAKSFTSMGAITYVGDAPTWVKNRKRFPSKRKLVLIDNERRHSIGLYALVTNDDGYLQVNREWLRRIYNLMGTFNLPSMFQSPEVNTQYGIIIVNPRNINKEKGFQLLARYLNADNYFMIGDSDSDIISDQKVTLCAVGNASSALKKRAVFVAKKDYTEGLKECLSWIAASKMKGVG